MLEFMIEGHMRNDQTTLSNIEVVETIVRSVARNKSRKMAADKLESARILSELCSSLEVQEPLTPEQNAMNTMLVELRANRTCCSQSWELFKRLSS